MRFDNLNVLVTGANRGLGYGILSHYLRRPNTTVIAAVRDPDSTQKFLQSLPTADHTSLVIIPTDGTSDEVTAAGISELTHAGCRHLDVVIANAGMAPDAWCSLIDADLANMERMVRTNGLSPLILYRNTLALMRRASSPRFVYISSESSVLRTLEPSRDPGYGVLGAGKALGNFITQRLAFENEHVLTFMILPGLVGTDAYAQVNGTTDGSQTPEECGEKLVKLISAARMETHRGRFFNNAGIESKV